MEKIMSYMKLDGLDMMKKLDTLIFTLIKSLYQLSDQTDVIIPCKLEDLPQLKDTKEHIQISNFNRFLGAPNIFYSDSSEEFYGRSIFTGKTDLFDDIDQCFSQGA